MAEKENDYVEMNYQEVKVIVHKCRKNTTHLWEKEDWDQEGMTCLHELLENHRFQGK